MDVARDLTQALDHDSHAGTLDAGRARPYSPAPMINAATILFAMRRIRITAVRACVCV
jgi:hypothetical protein